MINNIDLELELREDLSQETFRNNSQLTVCDHI